MAVGPTQQTREERYQAQARDDEFDKIKESQMQSLQQLEDSQEMRAKRGEITMTDAELITFMNQKDDDNFMNSPFFYLIFIWLFAGIGGNGFGFGGGNQALTNDFLYQQGQFQGINHDLQAGFADTAACCCSTNRNIDSVRYDLSQGLAKVGYDSAMQFAAMQKDMAECCCATNRNIDALSNQLTMSTAAIQQAICEDGRATRDLITANTIQELRDKLQSAELTLSNANQTQAIVAQILAHVPCGAPTV